MGGTTLRLPSACAHTEGEGSYDGWFVLESLVLLSVTVRQRRVWRGRGLGCGHYNSVALTCNPFLSGTQGHIQYFARVRRLNVSDGPSTLALPGHGGEADDFLGRGARAFIQESGWTNTHLNGRHYMGAANRGPRLRRLAAILATARKHSCGSDRRSLYSTRRANQRNAPHRDRCVPLSCYSPLECRKIVTETLSSRRGRIL